MEINDLIRDMYLTKSTLELFISKMKQWNLDEKSVSITSHRVRHESFSSFYTLRDGPCFCHDIPALFDTIGGLQYVSKEWRIFIDSSTTSLKVHSIKLKED